MAALFTLLLGCSALLLVYFLYDYGQQNFIRESEAAIDTEMQNILSVTESMDSQQRIDFIENKAQYAPHPIYVLQDENGLITAGNLTDLPNKISRLTEGVLRFPLRSGKGNYEMAAKIHTFDDGSTLMIARDITSIIDSNKKLKLITLLVTCFMGIVIFVSILISLFVVGRINTIAVTARDIIHTGDLSRRIAVQGNWDDLSNLAQILNNLLEKIESLMQGIRDVSDSIAHDLRTPLTRLNAKLEAMQASGATAQSIRDAQEESEGMLRTFSALLRIANIEKGKRLQCFSPVDLNVILNDVTGLYEPLAEDKNIDLTRHINAPVTLMGDRDLLFQCFANLLDNAIKYTPTGGRISIALTSHAQGSEVVIADSGPGASKEERTRLFERFYRTDHSRQTPGCGLGLSLVKAVTDLHQATISIDDNKPGLRVNIAFPALPDGNVASTPKQDKSC